MKMNGLIIKNNSSPADTGLIPVMEYTQFCDTVSELLKDETRHCPAYFCIKTGEFIRFFCFIADDSENTINILSHEQKRNSGPLKSLTPVVPQMHIFEREIHENSGVEFEDHPWLKPVRFPHDRYDKTMVMDRYPFYSIESEELHEVGVGPVHAGVIEPGHFRFICNGEKVLHLEIHLGYQHRGVEKLFISLNDSLKRSLLAESIAGDTAIGHSLAYVQVVESLAGFETPDSMQIERCIALELERLAVHIGDTAALCGDVAYQLGQAVCEALRTGIINTTQYWCGNRFGKGLVRPGGSNFPLTKNISDEILRVLDDTERRFREAADRIYSLPSLLARFEDIGIVTREQALSIGAVGMVARSSGVTRDIRNSHPFQYYKKYKTEPVIMNSGDVLSRGMLRFNEAISSIKIIRDLIGIWKNIEHKTGKPDYQLILKPSSLAVSLTEGWRGEIFHSAITDGNGTIVNYKIKDPSMHNWMALALAVRNQEISDFPLCNKSFNLSYCGNDL